MSKVQELIKKIEDHIARGASAYEALPMTKEEYSLCLEGLKLKDKQDCTVVVKTEVPAEDMSDFARRLNGIEYLEERKEMWEAAKEKGYVVVFGYSDDNIEFRGAIDDEIGAFGGRTVFFAKDGKISENNEGEYYIHAAWYGKVGAKTILKTFRIMDDDGDLIPWTYETNIPHEEFMMYEGGDPFCRGIVFARDSVISCRAPRL